MSKKLTIAQFSKRLPTLNKSFLKALSRQWDLETLETLEDSRDNAPLASGTLINSSSTTRAKITNNGIESSIIYKVPYAKKLNDPNSGLRLKEKGELSYTVKGVMVFKDKKGELGFLSNAVSGGFSLFKNAIEDSLIKAWRGL